MLRLRSCASSMTIVSYWLSFGSRWICASRMQSVTTRSRVFGELSSVNRT